MWKATRIGLLPTSHQLAAASHSGIRMPQRGRKTVRLNGPIIHAITASRKSAPAVAPVGQFDGDPERQGTEEQDRRGESRIRQQDQPQFHASQHVEQQHDREASRHRRQAHDHARGELAEHDLHACHSRGQQRSRGSGAPVASAIDMAPRSMTMPNSPPWNATPQRRISSEIRAIVALVSSPPDQ